MLNSIERLFEQFSPLTQGQPSQIATPQMVPLGTGFTTLALLTTRQLLQFAVQLLDLPTHGILRLKVVSGKIRLWMIGNDPVNVAICGNYLE